MFEEDCFWVDSRVVCAVCVRVFAFSFFGGVGGVGVGGVGVGGVGGGFLPSIGNCKSRTKSPLLSRQSKRLSRLFSLLPLLLLLLLFI